MRFLRQIIVFFALLSLFLVFCEVKQPLEIKDEAPKISCLFSLDTLYLFSDTSILLSVRVEDAQGIGDIAHVLAEWRTESTGASFHTDTLRDDGKGEDIIPGNGTYTKRFDTIFLRSASDSANLTIYAEDNEGHTSLSKQFTVMLLRAFRNDTTKIKNTPPVLSDLQAPSTVDRNSTHPILLTVAAQDSQGLSDIHSVFFNTYRPNGFPSSGNPFYMYDNGSSEYGDATAADGIYSRIIQITASSDTGNYRFEFFARDFSDSLSQPLIHMIKVYHGLE